MVMLKIVLFVYLLAIQLCVMHPRGHNLNVRLKIPQYVLLRDTVLLKCEYTVPFEQVHKVEWLKDEHTKLFRYVKGRNPPFFNYTIPGGTINRQQSNGSQLTITDIQLKATGFYSCEVTTETPIFTKQSEEMHLTVVQRQSDNPKISFNKKHVNIGDWVRVNCTSSLANPVPELTWLMNGEKVGEMNVRWFPEKRFVSTMELSFVILEEHRSGLQLTCLSTIPSFMGKHVSKESYVDHRSHSIKLYVMESAAAFKSASCRIGFSAAIFSMICAAIFLYM